MQSSRESHSHQLIYRQVDIDHKLAVFLNTANNGYFLFTFVKEVPCDSSSPYRAHLSVNDKAEETVVFECKSSNSAVYRIGKPAFSQLQLVNADFHFELDLDQWSFNSLKKDDYMQHNYQFFQKHSSETIHPWERD
uniref:Uncharacterized protein n=1 Tax=Vibrio ziniensis TaxID=2711221 RepID=A0A6G7CR58_9VIBR|nr:hypothetical protein G5S32_18245 [Vibrio ziniensis]